MLKNNLHETPLLPCIPITAGLMMQQQHSSMQPSLMPHGGMHRPSMSHHHSNNPLQMHTQLSQMMHSQHQQPHHLQQQPSLHTATSDMYHAPINSSSGDAYGAPQDALNSNALPHQTSQPLVDTAGIQVVVGELQAWTAAADLGGQQHEPLSLSLSMMPHQPKHLMMDGGGSGGGGGMLAYPPAGYSWVPAAMLDSRQDSLLRPPAA